MSENKHTVYTDDVNDDGTIDCPAENGPGIMTYYLPIKPGDMWYYPEHRFVSFTGFHMGMLLEARISYDMILAIADKLRINDEVSQNTESPHHSKKMEID